MSDSSHVPQVILTLDDVRRLKDERDAVAREYSALSERLDLLNRQLEAISIFLPAHLRGRILEEEQDEGRPRKWAPTIFRMLEDAGHDLTTADIKNRLRGSSLEHEMGPHGNALYNALSKIVAKGELEKKDNYYCLPGQEPPAGGVGRIKASQLEEDVLEVLRKNPDGLKSAEIIQKILRADMPSAAGMRKSAGGFYKALALLVAAGKVEKQGRIYFLPPSKDEPLSELPSNGSNRGQGSIFD